MITSAATHADGLRLSVGGVEVQHLHCVGTIPGVAILAAAARNGPGTGTLRSKTGGWVSYKAPGSATWGAWVNVPSTGDYLVEDGDDANKFIRARIYPSELYTGPVEGAIYLEDVFNNGVGHDDVTAAEASAGDITSWSVTLENDSPAEMQDLRAWLDATVGGIEISKNNVDWYTPNSEAHADVLIWTKLASGATTTLYLRRTIGAGASSDPEITNILHFAWDGA